MNSMAESPLNNDPYRHLTNSATVTNLQVHYHFHKSSTSDPKLFGKKPVRTLGTPLPRNLLQPLECSCIFRGVTFLHDFQPKRVHIQFRTRVL
jgi:hypothetical protein